MSSTHQTTYVEQISHQIEQMPDEYLPMLLKVILLFRQTVTLKPADESFRQGWQEAMRDETMPISDLWVDLDADDGCTLAKVARFWAAWQAGGGDHLAIREQL